MTKRIRMVGPSLLLLVLTGCMYGRTSAGAATDGPIPVRIVREDGGFKLLRGGEPYYIRGAVGERNLHRVVQAGGNSIRARWPDAGTLDSVHAMGLSVMYNLPLTPERNGMDYDDPDAVREQYERVMSIVREHKDHPAVLFWSLGNEMDHIPGNTLPNWKVYDAINELAVAIHEEDPNHPVMTVLGMGHDFKLGILKERAPALDLIGVNAYQDLGEVRGWLEEYGWDKPYAVTEWGSSGHWQVKKTPWGRPIEETEAEKAELRRERYVNDILANRDLALGSYSFLWWQKQETTHSWYGMFDEEDRSSESVDVLQHLWTGRWPENRAPRMESIEVDGKTRFDGVTLRPGGSYRAAARATDPEGDPLRYAWEVLREPEKYGSYAGSGEVRPRPVPNTIPARNDAAEVTFRAPAEPGEYRIHVYAYDGHDHYATANLPFRVQ